MLVFCQCLRYTVFCYLFLKSRKQVVPRFLCSLPLFFFQFQPHPFFCRFFFLLSLLFLLSLPPFLLHLQTTTLCLFSQRCSFFVCLVSWNLAAFNLIVKSMVGLWIWAYLSNITHKQECWYSEEQHNCNGDFTYSIIQWKKKSLVQNFVFWRPHFSFIFCIW